MRVDLDLASIVNSLDSDQFEDLIGDTQMIWRVISHALPFSVSHIVDAVNDTREESIRSLVDDGCWDDDVAHMRALARTLTEMADAVESLGAKKRGGTR